MNLCGREDLRALLGRHGFHFSKSMGQNFLIDPAVPAAISAASQAEGSCGVLEIGPGVGCLTAELAERAGKVVSIELDQKLLPVLAETMAPYPNVEIVPGDALKLDLAALAAEKFRGLRPLVCANLPYNITTPVLTKLVETPCFESVTVLLQKEVARRLGGGDGSYGGGGVYQWGPKQNVSAVPLVLAPAQVRPRPQGGFRRPPLRPAGAARCGDGGRGVFLPGGPGGLPPPAKDPGEQPFRRPAGMGKGAGAGGHGNLRPPPRRPGGEADPGGLRPVGGGPAKLMERSVEAMQENNKIEIVEKSVKTGITFGSALAMVISYTNWHSVGWAVIHGLMSWLYVIYYILRY